MGLSLWENFEEGLSQSVDARRSFFLFFFFWIECITSWSTLFYSNDHALRSEDAGGAKLYHSRWGAEREGGLNNRDVTTDLALGILTSGAPNLLIESELRACLDVSMNEMIYYYYSFFYLESDCVFGGMRLELNPFCSGRVCSAEEQSFVCVCTKGRSAVCSG